MTIGEVSERLNRLGIPVAYRGFKGKKTLPYICFWMVSSSDEGADIKKLYTEDDFIIDLYTRDKNAKLEQNLKALFPEIFMEQEEGYEIEPGFLINRFYFTTTNEK